MFLTRLKVVLVLTAALGLVGTGAGWLANAPGKGEPGAAAATPKDWRERDRRADALAGAREDLHHLTEAAESLDEKLTLQVIEARQRLVELEEQLRQTAGESPLDISAEQGRLQKETDRLQTTLINLNRVLKNADRERGIIALQKQLEEVRKRRQDLNDREGVWQAERNKHRIDLRRQIVPPGGEYPRVGAETQRPSRRGRARA